MLCHLVCIQEVVDELDFDDDKPLEFDMLRSVTKAHFAANPLSVTKNAPLRVPLIGYVLK